MKTSKPWAPDRFLPKVVSPHWRVVALQTLAAQRSYAFVDGPFGSNLKNEEYEDEGVPLIQLNNIRVGFHDVSNLKFVSDAKATSLAKHKAKPGDIVIAKMADPVARAAIVSELFPEYVIVADCIKLSVDKYSADTRFLVYAINAPYVRAIAEALAVGTGRLRTNLSTVRKLQVCLPHLPEQRAIADFLDRKTQAIDSLIQKKERLIALLQEKRQALITQAVTKGLNPTVPMKDSGIEWLGEIPAHWTLAPVYARYEVQLGKMLDAKRITGEHLAPYLRNVDVQWDRINLDDLPMMDFTPTDREKFVLEPGDLLVCEGGEVGRCAVWQGEIKECYYQKALHRVRPWSDKDNARFLYYVMCAVAKRGVFIAQGNPNTIDHLTAEKLRRYRFPFPPKHEQEAICRYLDSIEARITTTIGTITKQIDRLREYRQALISAAVTGKIDVTKETI